MNSESFAEFNKGYRIGDVLQQISLTFKSNGVPTPRLDAELLLAFLLKLKRLDLYLQADRPLTEEESFHFKKMAKRRIEGVPVAYLTQQKEFWSLSLHVASGVLIPRPETELLVETACSRIKSKQKEGRVRRLRVADLGTGSGAIMFALASELKELDLYGIDLSKEALSICSTNAHSHQQMLKEGQNRLILLQSNGLGRYLKKASLDFLLTNPPYIRTGIIPQLNREVQQEPRLALDGGHDGLDFYRCILKETIEVLVAGGELILEHGHDQRAEIMDLIKCHPEYHDFECFDDLEARPRVIKLVKG